MHRKLWHSDLHLAPAQVDALTMTELALACDGDMRPRPSDGGEPVVMSRQEIEAEIRRRAALTLAQRIAEARED